MVKGLILFLCMMTFAWADPPVATVVLSATEAWQRQQVIVRIDVQTKDPFAKLRIDRFEQEGFVVEPLSVVKTKVVSKGEVLHYILHAKWAIFPFVAGRYKVNLPRIRYHPNRGSLKTLKVENAFLVVKKLPIYVPPTMPVGKIILSSHWKEGRVVTTKSLLQWSLVITGEGVAKQTLPVLSRQLQSTISIEYLPAAVKRNKLETEQGISYQNVSIIAFKVRHNGRLDIPVFVVQYFDPEVGKLKTKYLSVPRVVALNRMAQWLIGGVLLLLFFWLGYKLIRYLNLILRRRSERRKQLNKLQEATNYVQLQEAFSHIARFNGWPDNLTITNNLLRYQQRYGDNTGLESKVRQLLVRKFSNNR